MKTGKAAVLVAPAAAFYLICFIIPLIYVLVLSLYNTNFVTTKFVGLGNYLRAVQDPDFQKTFFTALCYTVMTVPVTIYISYRLSLTMTGVGRRQMMLFQAIYFLPTLTSGIIISFVWRWVFGRLGMLEVLFTKLGLQPVAWLADGWLARVAISVAMIFSAIGGNCIWLCAVLLSVPLELYDQARIDGASVRQTRHYITLPHMAPTLGLIAFMQAMGTLQIWELIYSLTGGGPYKMTSSTVFDIYTTAFTYGRFGLAAAKSVILIVIIAALLLMRKIVR